MVMLRLMVAFCTGRPVSKTCAKQKDYHSSQTMEVGRLAGVAGTFVPRIV
jgi:hypothetical protein